MSMEMRNGSVLTLAIVALAMVGVAMFVLTEGANTMMFQADAAYLHAVQRNLTASGLAWAEHRTQDTNEPPAANPVDLDAAVLSPLSAGLTVHIQKTQDRGAVVAVETTCSKGRQTFTSSQDYTIPSQ